MQKSNKDRDWPTIIEKWQKSGMTKVAYCRQENVPESALYAAIKRERENQKPSNFTKQNFIKVSEQVPPSSVFNSCVIELRHGVKLTLEQVEVKQLSSLIQVLEGCNNVS